MIVALASILAFLNTAEKVHPFFNKHSQPQHEPKSSYASRCGTCAKRGVQETIPIFTE